MRPLLVSEPCCQILTQNFRFYNQQYKAALLAYVIMPNHLHFIIYFSEENKLSAYLRDFKKYTSLQIRTELQQSQPELARQLAYEHRSQHHKVWMDRFDDVCLYTRPVCETKLEYIHNNPVKAGLVADPLDYKYSSAKFYLGDQPLSELLDYREVF